MSILNLRDIIEKSNSALDKVAERVGVATLKKGTGDDYVGCCPIHQEKTPSFHVHPRRGFWKCFGCGEGGDAVALVEKTKRYTFPEAVEFLANTLNIPIEYNGLENLEAWKAAHKKEQSEKTALYAALEKVAAQCSQELTEKQRYDTVQFGSAARKYSAATVAAWGLGRFPAMPDIPKAAAAVVKAGLYKGRLIVPIRDTSGRIAGLAGRSPGAEQPKWVNSPESAIYQKSQILYGLFENAKAIEKANNAYLVEGYCDVITPWEKGIPCVATCGTALTPEQAKLLRRYTDNVTVWRDGDDAGAKAARRDIPILLAEGFAVSVVIPAKGDDPDAFCRREENPAALLATAAQDGFFWYVLDGYNPTKLPSKLEAIRRAKEALKHIEETARRLYIVELEKRLEMTELWRYLKDDTEADTAAIAAKAAEMLKKETEGQVPFPVSAFPASIAETIRRWATETNLPADYWGANILAIAGAAIGNKYVAGYRGQIHPALLYMVLVGHSGGGKTPTQKRCLEPLFQHDIQLRQEHAAAMERYKQSMFDHAATNSKGPAPIAPELRENWLLDCTPEYLTKALANNQFGILSWQNELKGFLDQLTRYSSGSSLALWLNMFDVLPYKSGRSGSGAVSIQFPYVCLLTGVQPHILRSLATAENVDTGFIARLLFAYPEDLTKPDESDQEPDPELLAGYSKVISRLITMPSRIFPPQGDVRDWYVSRIVVPLDPEAQAAYREWRKRNTALYNSEENDPRKSANTKLESVVLRVALILHFLTLASEDENFDKITENPEEFCNIVADLKIPKQTLLNATALAEYFRYTSGKVLGRIESPVNTLKSNMRAYYMALPEVFDRKTAIEIAGRVDPPISVRTLQRFLNDRVFFGLEGRGAYRKKFE